MHIFRSFLTRGRVREPGGLERVVALLDEAINPEYLIFEILADGFRAGQLSPEVAHYFFNSTRSLIAHLPSEVCNPTWSHSVLPEDPEYSGRFLSRTFVIPWGPHKDLSLEPYLVMDMAAPNHSILSASAPLPYRDEHSPLLMARQTSATSSSRSPKKCLNGQNKDRLYVSCYNTSHRHSINLWGAEDEQVRVRGHFHPIPFRCLAALRRVQRDVGERGDWGQADWRVRGGSPLLAGRERAAIAVLFLLSDDGAAAAVLGLVVSPSSSTAPQTEGAHNPEYA
ncbi:hypothetical protein B0H14DRAFT_2634033 [Mycena olivaceomarginata]|nr:hypothetical protein B0H14DRAFT_2634033 [Mycena olivaceomarginata]